VRPVAQRTKRGDVIATLNRLVREGVITSFQTQLFDKDRSDKPDVAVAVADLGRCDEVLRQVQEALQPLGMDLSVVVDLRGIPGEGCS
jgi:hypothetical protein